VAVQLLALADDSGLTHLAAVCLDYIVHHHDTARKTAAYRNLSAYQVSLIASEACALFTRLRSILYHVNDLQCQAKKLPEATY
jgi:hypothetical protein